ncbi:MAG TPA: hypothetical protein VE244_01665 [Nitrososphaeraceae archaeon]|jgi:hypothetical protein|nr:hypothetical protein [Nitrososphaeraceae archaeon]
MRPKIPESVRRNVISEWLHGISRDEVAKNNDIGAGTVSAIIKEAMQEDPEFDLQRQVALSLKKENNLDVKSFASLIRIRNKLIKEMGLNNDEKSKVVKVQEIEHKIEPLILNLAVFCFKRGFSIEEFVDMIQNMSSLEHKIKIPIEQLPNELLQKQRHLESTEKKTQEIKLKKQLLLNDYNITADTLEEYKTNRPSFEKYIKLKKEFEETKRERKGLLNRIYELEVRNWMRKYSWSTPTSDIDIVNSDYNIRGKLTGEQLLKMAQDLVNHPRKYIDIIVSLQKRYLELAEVDIIK